MMRTTDRPIGKVQAQDLQRDVAMDLRKMKAEMSKIGALEFSELKRFPHAIGEPVCLLHTEEAPALTIPLEGGTFYTGELPELFEVFGYRFGGSAGSFKVPDLRGVVLKGWNHGKASGIYDKEAVTRTNRGDGTTGDHVGTLQEDRLQKLTGGMYITEWSDYWSGVFSGSYLYGARRDGSKASGTWLSFDSSKVARSGLQTNDSNMSVLWVTRYTWKE
ncbi:MAG TPA: phage tail protein [Candidatus Latescibacteria bacterium]|nr:phage tail protein [Spirochaetota bacterium]HPU86365.1 phage tail protein [Candidatus Latescibacterota bacterium]